ncbi:MAG TPA: ATP-binding protein [Rhodocyclaceae bacterium]|nr:ATP-binding protein [Rhodocyclaceae bacterium]
MSLWHSYRDHIHQAEIKSVTLARAVEQHATATIDRANLALLAVIPQIRPDDLRRSALSKDRQLTDILANQHRLTRGVVSISLTNADGVVVANSVGAPPGTDLGQRSYFRRVKAGAPDSIVISEAIKGKVSNHWGLQVARRISLPDGSFGGMVVANLGLYENFESFYQSLDIGPAGLITLRSPENTVLVRFPVVEAVLGKATHGSLVSQAIDGGVTEKVVRSVSPVDQVDRITAVRRLPDYPIYTVVGMAHEGVLVSWLRESATLLAMSLVILPLSGLVSVMAERRYKALGRLRAAEQALAQEREARHQLLEQQVAERTAALRTANHKLESFLYAASHDLKGPLGRISNFSSLLERYYRPRLEGDGLRFLDFIHSNAIRLNNLVDDLLTHARVDQQEYRLVPVDILAAVQAALQKRQEDIRERGAVIRLELPADRILADAYGLSQVLANLIENALKYSAESSDPIIEIGGERVGERFRLWVRDNGIGFDMEYQEKIFELFRRLHTYVEYAGSGVGLALVKRAMEQMGGRVWAESEPGQGATFYLDFAAAPPVAVSAS